MTTQPHKFVKWDVPTLEDLIARYKQAEAWKKLADNNGDITTLTPEERSCVSPSEGYFTLMGWYFPCRQFMRRFWYRVTYDGGNYDMGQVYAYDLDGAYSVAPQDSWDETDDSFNDDFDIVIIDVTEAYKEFQNA